MDPEKIHIDKDRLIDMYIRNELSDQETILFEEHLLSCAGCRKEIIERSRIIDSIERHAAGELFQSAGPRDKQSKKSNPIIWYLAAAAGVALVIGIFLLPNRNTPASTSHTASSEIQKDSTESPRTVEDEITRARETAEKDLHADPQKKLAYLSEYKAYPVLENQIGINMRSAKLEVELPSDSIGCSSGSSIEIVYHMEGADSLYLVILNNQGEILNEEKIASPHKYQMQFPARLYYWQLTDEEESLHTAKIYIRSDS